jgi:hypothetical protein
MRMPVFPIMLSDAGFFMCSPLSILADQNHMRSVTPASGVDGRRFTQGAREQSFH